MTTVAAKMDAGQEPLKVSVGDSEEELSGGGGGGGDFDLKVRKSASVLECSSERTPPSNDFC